VLRALVEESRVVPVVTATYSLEKVSLAIGRYWAGHARGERRDHHVGLPAWPCE
jgi:hypothetical protein